MVREAVLSAVKETPVAVEVRYSATMQLLKSEFSDDKLAGMILFQEKILPDPAARALLYPAGGLGPVLDDVGELFADESLIGLQFQLEYLSVNCMVDYEEFIKIFMDEVSKKGPHGDMPRLDKRSPYNI